MNGTGSITSGTPRRHRETKEQSVAIVGAGPTGVMLAIELARRGVNVRVLDRLSSPPTESRATGIHARTLEIFRQLGLVEEFLAVGQRLDGFALHTQRRRPVRVRWADLDTPYPFLLNLPQALTQRILDRHLESLGISVERGAEVTDVRQDAEHVELSVARVGGEGPQTVTVDWAVGCDGAHSIVRRRLGVSFDGDDYGQDWLMADLNLDPAPPRDHFHIHLHTPVAFVALPLPSGRFRIFLPQVPNRAAAPRTAPDMDEIKRLAAVRGPAGLSLSDPDLLAAFRCYRRSTSTLRHGRVLVAGDAAHIHTPAGGQGLNTGMQDAFNLAWKLALVAQGQAPVALLDSYQAERLPVAAGVLALSHAMVSAFNVPSARRRWLRDRILPAAVAVPPLRRRFTNRMAELSINYRGGPLTDSRTGPWRRGLEPGERLVDAPCLTSEGLPTSMLGLLSTRHTLFILAGERPDPHVVQALVARFSRFGELLEPVILSRQGLADHGQGATDPNLRVHDRYRARGGKLLLVRPDGYLAADAALGDPGTVERYLLQLTGRASSNGATPANGAAPANGATPPTGATLPNGTAPPIGTALTADGESTLAESQRSTAAAAPLPRRGGRAGRAGPRRP